MNRIVATGTVLVLLVACGDDATDRLPGAQEAVDVGVAITIVSGGDAEPASHDAEMEGHAADMTDDMADHADEMADHSDEMADHSDEMADHSDEMAGEMADHPDEMAGEMADHSDEMAGETDHADEMAGEMTDHADEMAVDMAEHGGEETADQDAPAATPADTGTVVEIEMFEYGYAADVETIPAGEPVTFRFVNSGAIPHEAMFGSLHMQDEFAAQGDHGDGHGEGGHHGDVAAITLDAGETGDITLEFPEPGELWIGCHLAGHWEAGMSATLRIV